MRKGRIPDAWFGAQVDQADRFDGDIDTLSSRIAQIRTWTFVANRPDWLADPEHWQGIAREVENKLSDALHERLTERFVDRRTSVLMRRLRENTMLNTEIGKTGEVIVEGHVIGRLDGFTFAPDAAEAGSDAKALQATAQKALAGEIDTRAEKLAAAPDEQFVLTSDGTIRWTGDAVAKLVAADDALHPRFRIISDERLAGAPREAVQARLDLWLKTHIEKLLGPLFELAKAEDITGIARGIAFQLIESLGVLERAKIAAEMKDLDQPSRASLRKYGVRFGAYHIYVPPLLKPAARALASLLWAQKQDNVDMSALSGAQHLAGSGRTSFPVDKLLDRDAYRVLGYRQCGERAVRVDILERLADLIRPALSWRETSPGAKPAGAFDGRGFVVTQAMTSLTGSAGEDFASILRALGYRMERRPAPPKPAVVETVAAAEAVPEMAPEATAETSSEAVTEGAPVVAETLPAQTPPPEPAAGSGDVADTASDVPPISEEVVSAPSATLLPDIAFSPATGTDEPASVGVESTDVPSDQAASSEAQAGEATQEQEQAAGETAVETAATDAVVAAEADATAAATSDAVAAPEMVDVWRPGGRPDDRRPRHDRHRHRHQDRPQPHPQEGAPPSAVANDSADGARRERHGRGRRDRHNDFRKPSTDAPVETVAAADAAPVREPREDKGRPPRERFQGKDRHQDRDKGKFGGGRDKGGREKGGRGDKRSEGGPSHRQFATSAPPRERDRPIDPNSPFAKLAVLKEQLTARKDQR
jgi:ATP-dependent RNA helicase SUPV3L1/SUV3